MSKEHGPKQHEEFQLPELDYSLALPFGKFMMSQSASDSLSIVPLVPSIEEFPVTAVNAGNDIDILVATTDDKITQEQIQAYNLTGKNRPICLVEVDPPVEGSNDFSEAVAKFIFDRVPEMADGDVTSLQRNLEQGKGQAIAHVLADYTAQSAAEVYMETMVRNSDKFHLRGIRFSWISTAIGSVALSVGLDTPIYRAAGVGAMVAFNGYTNVRNQKLVNRFNSIEAREAFEAMYLQDIHRAIHDAFCAAHANRGLNDLLGDD